MKLSKVIKEDGAAITYRELDAMQVGVLLKLDKGQISDETATPQQLAILDSLRNLQIIDTYGELTSRGVRAVELAKKYGSTPRRKASRMDSALGREGGKSQRYTDVDDGSEVSPEEGGPFRDRWEDVRDQD